MTGLRNPQDDQTTKSVLKKNSSRGKTERNRKNPVTQTMRTECAGLREERGREN